MYAHVKRGAEGGAFVSEKDWLLRKGANWRCTAGRRAFAGWSDARFGGERGHNAHKRRVG
jgi:hypothetical protein